MLYIYTQNVDLTVNMGRGRKKTSKIVSSFARNGWLQQQIGLEVKFDPLQLNMEAIFFARQRWQMGNPLKLYHGIRFLPSIHSDIGIIEDGLFWALPCQSLR
jgi:hypothetical protein